MNGIVLIVLIYGTASISGGHLNPAVSAGLAITQQISPLKMAVYWVAQIAGGVVGAAWVYAINTPSESKIFGSQCISAPLQAIDSSLAIRGCNSCTLPAAGLSGGQIFGIEFLATFTLVFTVFASAVDPRGAAGNAAPFAIGGSLWACAQGIGGLTGGALNPARTLSPAIVFGCWSVWTGPGVSDGKTTYWYAYVLAQLLAGCSAGLIYKFAFLNRPDDGQPGPASVFKFVARDGMAVRRELTTTGNDVEAPAVTAAPKGPVTPRKVKGPITPRGGNKPTTPKGMVKVIDHGSGGKESNKPISEMI